MRTQNTFNGIAILELPIIMFIGIFVCLYEEYLQDIVWRLNGKDKRTKI